MRHGFYSYTISLSSLLGQLRCEWTYPSDIMAAFLHHSKPDDIVDKPAPDIRQRKDFRARNTT